jgi:hypothetical protein
MKVVLDTNVLAAAFATHGLCKAVWSQRAKVGDVGNILRHAGLFPCVATETTQNRNRRRETADLPPTQYISAFGSRSSKSPTARMTDFDSYKME